MRRNRFALFESLISNLSLPLCILDVGGAELYWRQVGYVERDDIEIVLLNLTARPTTFRNIRSIAGDARDMSQFADGEFDVIHSNSVIEHMGGCTEQARMAREVQRVGKAYFVQTPNYYFPIEPHSFVPFLQFFPRWAKSFLVRRFTPKQRLMVEGFQDEILEIQMLTRRQLEELFPGGHIWEEKVFGLTRSFVVYGGWK